MDSYEDLMALINAGKKKEALELLERLKAANKFAPTMIKASKTGAVFYKGNRRVVQNAAGEWELALKKQ
ncbi:hypothetical protein QTA58_23425 [Neorhizobium sp. CSC1952]|uniref:hypothetical protein n=1 Tax=Neorhizobium sp. CSC1952 TaxID=2978974 RepID=UPI0025A67A4D|nr:hypothetical protein [Rhizobium sp. CSC1952]WJR67093.1 hypothetical protein QTA58_23425 [Rhizobium sp. CSC1952]